jgi:hypothetical protein
MVHWRLPQPPLLESHQGRDRVYSHCVEKDSHTELEGQTAMEIIIKALGGYEDFLSNIFMKMTKNLD